MWSKKKRSLRSLEHLFLWKHILTPEAGCLSCLRVREWVSLAVLGKARGLPPRLRCSVHASFCVLKIYIYIVLLKSTRVDVT